MFVFNTAERYLKRYLTIPKNFFTELIALYLPDFPSKKIWNYCLLLFLSHFWPFHSQSGALFMMPWICATCASTVISIWSYRLLRKMLTHSDTKQIWHRFKIFTVNKRYFKFNMIYFSTVTMYLNFYVNSLNSMAKKDTDSCALHHSHKAELPS